MKVVQILGYLCSLSLNRHGEKTSRVLTNRFAGGRGEEKQNWY